MKVESKENFSITKADFPDWNCYCKFATKGDEIKLIVSCPSGRIYEILDDRVCKLEFAVGMTNNCVWNIDSNIKLEDPEKLLNKNIVAFYSGFRLPVNSFASMNNFAIKVYRKNNKHSHFNYLGLGYDEKNNKNVVECSFSFLYEDLCFNPVSVNFNTNYIGFEHSIYFYLYLMECLESKKKIDTELFIKNIIQFLEDCIRYDQVKKIKKDGLFKYIKECVDLNISMDNNYHRLEFIIRALFKSGCFEESFENLVLF